MILADRTDRDAAGDRTVGASEGESRSAACVMPAVGAVGSALRSFAHDAARRWGLPDSVCDVVALMTSELVDQLAGFGIGLDTHLTLTVDDTAVSVQVREAGRPRPLVRPTAGRGGRRPRREEASAVPRRSVGGARLEAVILLPEPESDVSVP